MIGGCGQSDPPPTTAPTEAPAIEPEATMIPITESTAVVEEDPVVEVEQVAPTENAAPAVVEPTDVPPTITAAVEPAEETEPVADDAEIYNGVYEYSYFRGSAAAPVTLIDYSDFL